MNYKQNPLGIYVYSINMENIDNVNWRVNSILNNIGTQYRYRSYGRIINSLNYGFNFFYNVHKK